VTADGDTIFKSNKLHLSHIASEFDLLSRCGEFGCSADAAGVRNSIEPQH
jgi:hypothetical protein